MVFPEARGLGRRNKVDAAVTENTGRPFWRRNSGRKRRKWQSLSSQPRKWLSPSKGEGIDCLVQDVAKNAWCNGASVPQVVRSFPSGADRVACQRFGQEHIEESINGSKTRKYSIHMLNKIKHARTNSCWFFPQPVTFSEKRILKSVKLCRNYGFLLKELVDRPRTTKGTSFAVLHSIFLPFLMSCGPRVQWKCLQIFLANLHASPQAHHSCLSVSSSEICPQISWRRAALMRNFDLYLNHRWPLFL